METLCKALGIPSGPLQEAAALERSSPTIRKRLETVDRERAKLRRARDRLLLTALYAWSQHDLRGEDLTDSPGIDPAVRRQLLVLIHRVRGLESLARVEQEGVRIFEGVRSRQRDALLRVFPEVLQALVGREPAASAQPTRDGASAPLDARPHLASWRTKRVPIGLLPLPPDVEASEDAFFWTLEGDNAYPHLEAGDLLLIDPTISPAPGDIVVLHHDKVPTVRRYGTQNTGSEQQLRLASLTAQVPPLRLSADTPVHVVLHMSRTLR